MAISDTTLPTIYDSLSRVGMKMYNRQVNDESEFLSFLQKGAMKSKGGGIGKIKIGKGLNDSAKLATDAGYLPQASSSGHVLKTYLPVAAVAHFGMGSLALEMNEKDSLVEDLLMELEDCFGAINTAVSQGLFGHSTIWTSAAGAEDGSTTSFTLTDMAGIQVGQVLSVIDASGTDVWTEYIQVTDVNPDETDGVGGTITVSRDFSAHEDGTASGGAHDFLTGDYIVLRGHMDITYLNGGLGADLANAVSQSASLYGVAATSYDYKAGFVLDTSGDIEDGDLKKMWSALNDRRGATNRKKRIYVAGSYVTQILNGLDADLTRFTAGQVKDKFLNDGEISYGGIRLIEEVHCQNGVLYCLDTRDVQLHQFCELKIESDRAAVANQNALGASTMHLSRTKFQKEAQVWRADNLRVTRRNGLGKITGITGPF